MSGRMAEASAGESSCQKCTFSTKFSVAQFFSVLNINFLPTLKSEATYIATSYLRKQLLIHYSCPVSYIINLWEIRVFFMGLNSLNRTPFGNLNYLYEY